MFLSKFHPDRRGMIMVTKLNTYISISSCAETCMSPGRPTLTALRALNEQLQDCIFRLTGVWSTTNMKVWWQMCQQISKFIARYCKLWRFSGRPESITVDFLLLQISVSLCLRDILVVQMLVYNIYGNTDTFRSIFARRRRNKECCAHHVFSHKYTF